jgi:hypothetical protein
MRFVGKLSENFEHEILCGHGEANEHILAVFVSEAPETCICLTAVVFLGSVA